MRLLLLVALTGCCLQLCSAQEAFLQAQLPLKVLVTTPSELAATAEGPNAITVTGRQAITAVFSRPVIALGSDWGSKQLPDNLVPFSLSCSVPGRLRWVTTNIARFDPSVDWPTDLDCTFSWNKGLKSYDGAPLQLGDLRASVRLQTQPLSMNIERVESEAAMAATGNQWSALLGLPDDKLPEVPPDANMTLTFSYPVELSQLAKALKVAGPGAGSRTVTVSPCVTPVVTPVPFPIVIFTANGVEGSSSGSAGGTSPADLMKLNSTCAVVKIVPGLSAGSEAVLRLPKGARYSSVAGPATQDVDAKVFGLRPFRIPLRWDFMNITKADDNLYSGVTYRRLSMWLPHGLAKDTQLAALKPLIQLCRLKENFAAINNVNDIKDCQEEDFELIRPAKAMLVMRVPNLQPRERYAVRIKADDKVKDAFGLPLQASGDTWWTLELESAFAAPNINQVALLESIPGNPSLIWPWVFRGAPPDGMKQVQGWSVPVGGNSSNSSSVSSSNGSTQLEKAIASVVAGYGGAPATLLGAAGTTVARPNALWPTFQSLTLPGQPGISYVAACCRQVTWPSPRAVLDNNVMVVQSNLQAAFVEQQGKLIAWVTTSQGQSKPVAGAKVQVYNSAYGKESATLGASCTTGPEGTCTLDLSPAQNPQKASNKAKPGSSAFQPSFENIVRSAVITAQGHGPLVVPTLPYSGSSLRSSSSSDKRQYVGRIVLDRKLVKPGDDLHVTAYIQQKVGSQLQLAKDLPSVILQISPSFYAPVPGSSSSRNSASSRTRMTLEVDPTYGSIHATIPIPRNATPANYNVQLWTPAGADAGQQAPEGLQPIPLTRPVAVPKTAPSATAGALPVMQPAPATAMSSVARPAPKLPQPNTSSANAGSGSSNRRRLQQQVPSQPAAVLDDAVPADADLPEEQAPPSEDPTTTSMSEPPVSEPSVSEPATGAATSSSQPAPGFASTRPASASAPLSTSASEPIVSLGSSIASASFTVGDPRPPTASLALNASSGWVKPDGVLTVVLTAKSYVGSAASGAEVTLAWSTNKAKGEMTLKTDDKGVATGKVELGKLPAANRSEPGDKLSLRASWIGPTREPLMQSKSIKVADGPTRVELQRSLLTDVPGVAFGVRADAFSNEDDSPVKGATVEISLSPRNGSASLANCNSAQKDMLAKQQCKVKSGDPGAAVECQLVLPCPGEFLLKGCVKDGNSSSNGGCSKPLKVGRNLTAWAAAPWSAGPGQIVLLPADKNVTQGSMISLTLQNPYWGPASGLLVWGNGEQREQKFLPEILQGVSTVEIHNVGPECRGGCRVALLLAVSRPPGSSPLGAQRPSDGVAAKSSQPNGSAAGSDIVGNDAQDNPLGGLVEAPTSPQQKSQKQQAPSTGSSTRTQPNTVVRRISALWPFNINIVRHGIWGNRGARSQPERGNGKRSDDNSSNGSVASRSDSGGVSDGIFVSAPPNIPRSLLYDPLAPVTASAEVELESPAGTGLQVSVAVTGQSKDAAGLAVVAPKSKQGRISVSVKDASGGAVPDAEVTLVVVDKAVLDLMPYELQDVSGAFKPQLSSYFSLVHLNAMRVTRPAINATFSTLKRRLLNMDPWLPLDTQVIPSGGVMRLDTEPDGYMPPPQVAAVDVPDAKYLPGYNTALTPVPYVPCNWADGSCQLTSSLSGHPANAAMADGVAMNAVGKPMAMASMAVPAPAPAPSLTARSKSFAFKGGEAADAATAGGGSKAPSAAAAGADLRLQQAFKITPMFKVVKTGSDGNAAVDFPAPDNLGRFVVRAYAAAPKASVKASNKQSSSNSAVLYGSSQSGVLVRRTVSLIPALPRQVRAGDNFTAGVLVEAPGTVNDITVTVTAALGGGTSSAGNRAGGSSSSSNAKVLNIGSTSSATVKLTPSKPQQEVRFDFSAASIGQQNITFVASAAGQEKGAKQRQLLQNRPAGDVADQVQLQVQVLGKQSAVLVATSFAIRGSGSSSSSNNNKGSWQEGLVLPHAERGSGSINLVAGVGSLPAVQTAYSGLADQGLASLSGCTSSSQAVALSVLPAFLAMYGSSDKASATSHLSSSQVQLTQAAAQAVTGKLTHAKFGLLAVEPSCLYPYSRGTERADIGLNAWAAWLAQQAISKNAKLMTQPGSRSSSSNGSGSSNSPGVLSSSWASIQSTSQTWIKAAEQQLVADAVAARRGQRGAPPAPYSDLETLAWARLVLGSKWTPTVPKPSDSGASDVSAEVQKDLSMQRLTAAALAGNLTVGGQSRVGLTLLQQGPGGKDSSSSSDKADAEKIAKRLLSSVRVGGRTAYVATGEGKKGAAGLSDQSMALAFFVAASSVSSTIDNPLVQKVAAWVAQGAAPPPIFFAALCVSSNPWEASLRAQSLTSYDSSTSSTAPDLKLAVNAVPRGSPADNKGSSTGSNSSSDKDKNEDNKAGSNTSSKGVQLLSASFTPSNAGELVNSSKGWEAVPFNSSLRFSAQGQGEVSVAAALNFTPANLLPFPTYRGLWVQRAVLPDAPDGSSSSKEVGGESGIGLGKMVTVVAQVTSPDDQADVLVEVLMPGGLEPLDPNVFKDPEVATICRSSDDESPLESSSNDGGGGFSGPVMAVPGRMGIAISSSIGVGSIWRPWWPICPVQTTTPELVSFRFSYMRAGTHTMRFKAVAATSGTFVLPPVKAFVQQQPEVMGLSPAGTLTVCLKAEGCKAGSVAAAVAAKGCPNDCNGNGACNLATGVCICDAKFSGPACGAFSTY